jgi:hypothetical protein
VLRLPGKLAAWFGSRRLARIAFKVREHVGSKATQDHPGGWELLTPQEQKDYRPMGCPFRHVANTGEPS